MRRGVRALSFGCLLLFTAQLASESAASIIDHSGRIPSVQAAAGSPRSTCLPSAGRAESMVAGARTLVPTAPDSRIQPADRQLAKRLSANPVSFQPLHRPPHSLLRQRLRLSARDDVPG